MGQERGDKDRLPDHVSSSNFLRPLTFLCIYSPSKTRSHVFRVINTGVTPSTPAGGQGKQVSKRSKRTHGQHSGRDARSQTSLVRILLFSRRKYFRLSFSPVTSSLLPFYISTGVSPTGSSRLCIVFLIQRNTFQRVFSLQIRL